MSMKIAVQYNIKNSNINYYEENFLDGYDEDVEKPFINSFYGGFKKHVNSGDWIIKDLEHGLKMVLTEKEYLNLG